LTDSISQYGITWTFEHPVRAGRFLTGDYYVVGPVTVSAVSPAPTGEGEAFRNGSMLNPPVDATSAYDGRMDDFKPALAAEFPLRLKAGDSLVSTISLAQRQRNQIIPDVPDKPESSVLRTAAVLTCLDAPVPADTFRPGYCDQKKDKLHRASEIHWDLLPTVQPTASAVEFDYMERAFQRPWLDHVYSWSSRDLHPSENMPGYGREVGRIVSWGALLLCCNYPQEQKATLCHGMIQVGIDNWAIAKRGVLNAAGGWPAQGGFGNGRKWPIVFAGIVLNDEEMLHIKQNAPGASFGEDEHTAFGPCWTGAKVLFTGQYPLVAAQDPERYADRSPYEHLHPSEWPGRNKTMSEGYRRCCTSLCWVGQALATRLMHAEEVWDHDAFFAYVDRWMTEDDTEFVKIIKEVHDTDYSAGARQRQCWDAFVEEMWARYRNNLPPAPDGHQDPPAEQTWK